MNPENEQTAFTKGIEFFNDRKYSEACLEFEKAAQTTPDAPDVWKFWGSCFYYLQNYPEAVLKFEKAFGLKLPFDSQFYFEWVDSLLKLNKFDDALKKINEVEKIKGTTPLSLKLRGNIYFYKRDYQRSLKKYKKAVSIDDKYDSAYFNIGLVYYNLENYQESKTYFEKAVELSPENGLYHLSLADILLALRKYDKAKEKYEVALKLNQENNDVLYVNWGISCFYLNDFEVAVTKFDKALELKPENSLAFFFRGYIFEKQNSYDLAIEEYKKALNLGEAQADALFALGAVKLRQRKYEEAINYFDQTININKKYTSAFFNRALALWQLGRYVEGWKDWEELLYLYDNLDYSGKLKIQPELAVEYGKVLYYIFGDSLKAEKMFKIGIGSISDIELQLDRLALYLELKNSILETDNKFHWNSQIIFNTLCDSLNLQIKEKEELIENINSTIFVTENSDEAEDKIDLLRKNKEAEQKNLLQSLYSLGMVKFEMEQFEEALKQFLRADELIKNSELENSPELQNAIGICYSNLGKHSEALNLLNSANEGIFNDFMILNNFAGAYLKAFYDATGDSLKSKYLETAEKGYRKVLRLAPNNIDAHIGLGNVLFELSEFGSQGLYEESIQQYDQALDLAKFRKGSRRLSDKEKAAIHYSRGFVTIRLYSEGNSFKKKTWLKNAYKDFRTASEIDAEHYSAKRAYKTLNQRLSYFISETFFEKISPIIIVLLSLGLFGFTIYTFTNDPPSIDSPKEISTGYFVTLMFGSLIFLIAGLSLPFLVKLKFGTIELEKEIRENIPQNEDFGMIKKQLWGNNLSQIGLWNIPGNKSAGELEKM